MKGVKPYQMRVLKAYGQEHSEPHILAFKIGNSFTKRQLISFIVDLVLISKKGGLKALEKYYQSLKTK